MTLNSPATCSLKAVMIKGKYKCQHGSKGYYSLLLSARHSEIVIDGHRAKNGHAREINEFYEVYPYSLDTGHNDTKILIREDENGMYFGFINATSRHH